MSRYNYPCTGKVHTKNFGQFLDQELNENRRNIKLLAASLRDILGVEYISLVNSGSSANLAAAIAVRQLMPKRNKVLLAGFSFPTTISSFALQGFEVELVDVEKLHFNMSTEALARHMSEEVACVCVTHFLGFPADLQGVKQLCEQYGALLVQDACETMDLRINDQLIYEFGDIITHSFYHPHHLSSYGGGAVVVPDPETHRLIESIIHWGRRCSCHYDKENCTAPEGINHNFWYERLGVNVEMSELNACFGRFQLQTWEQQEATRNKYYNLVYDALKEVEGIRIFKNEYNISPFVFPIIVAAELKEQMTQEIMEGGVEVRSIMGGAIHKHPAYTHLYHEGLVNTEEVGKCSFFMGIHQTLQEKQVREAAEIVRSTMERLTTKRLTVNDETIDA